LAYKDRKLLIKKFYHKKSGGNSAFGVLCMEVEAFGMFLGLLLVNDRY
jgi:hypothetical protein